MRRLFLALAGMLALACAAPASAQSYRVVASCGAQSLRIGDGSAAFLDPTGNLCTSGTGGGGGSSVVAGSQEQDVRASASLNTATANAAVTLALNGQGTVGWTFTGLTASGATLTFEQSNDGGGTWTGINEVNAGTGVPTGTRNTDGQTRVSVSGRTNVRVRVSTTGTGTVTVASNISVREGIVTLGSSLPPGSNALGSVLSDLRVAGAAVAAGNPVPVAAAGTFPADTVIRATPTSRSGTIAAGGTAQQLMAANPVRRGYVIQNQSTGDLYVNGIATATLDQNSLKIPAGGYYETPMHQVGPGAVSIIGATTGQAFFAREF